MRITRSAVKQVIFNLLGEYPVHIVKINNGNTNKIYKATLQSNNWLIIRISEWQDKINHYLKEQWCSNKIRKIGIPTPEILEVGNTVIPFPYMIVRETLGIPGNQYEGDKERMITEIGEYAKTIHQIKTNGFGEVFNWSKNVLSRNQTWEQYLQKEFPIDQIVDSFEKTQEKVLTTENFKKLQNATRKIKSMKFDPSLAHGDFLPKNVIVNNEGKIISVIDWESAKATHAQLWDLSTTLNNLKPEEREFVIKGYGLSKKEYQSIAREIDALWVIKKSDIVIPAVERKEIESVKHLITKFNTVLEGYKA